MTREPTAALLLGLCRGQLDDAARAQAEVLLAQPIDWDLLAELAALHGVVGLVRRNLVTLDARASVPAGAWQRMQNAANQIAFDGVLQLRETERMSAALNRAGIEPIILKGHALADQLYADPLVRPSADIDLLVARSDLARAEDALAATGYVPLSASKRASQLQQSYHVSLYREAMPGLQVLLELHWDLGDAICFATTWTRGARGPRFSRWRACRLRSGAFSPNSNCYTWRCTCVSTAMSGCAGWPTLPSC
ncbi:MAG: nucleotidyltransferase family protein [Caldilineales bacterium]